ncbi:hypothetical protein B1992_07205 [Pseudoxanthomonas broegbernensis]|uniref:Thioredoxin family protein n=1 Tax=Pseudoxanthomonas broegbernensis TaxID=83619 RepID=A0A7V8K7N1_9GAMM|nr:thioredoxin family protein [Pseudoxanthomonas broegbernensis]KAF1686687.1 hypothetical protein B1992_07205 [Pseudoxanthomonas broegbernensis]MBB6063553.1 hypothetical protein [Pseudoxanthomonas broegbernensis]
MTVTGGGSGRVVAGIALALLLAACAGEEPPAVSGPPLPVDTSPQKPAVADANEPVASGNTRAAADVAAIAALGAAFDPARDAAADLETAKVEAKRGRRRIVLELGDASCTQCAALDALIEGQAPLRHLRDAGFVWVKVDRSAPGNAGLLAGYPGGTDAPAPYLLVLDADGQVLHAQPGQDLMRDDRPWQRQVRGFLERWAPPAP